MKRGLQKKKTKLSKIPTLQNQPLKNNQHGMKEKYNLGGSKHALKCVLKYILSILKLSISTGTYYKDTIHETTVHTIICRQINGTE